jgi:hypothetical protein
MISRFRARERLGVGIILIVAGIFFWILAIVLPITSLHFRLLDHVGGQSLPIIAGGATLVGGIMFLLAPRRRRRRRYYDDGESLGNLALTTPPTPDRWDSPNARDGLRLVGAVTPPPSHLQDAQ